MKTCLEKEIFRFVTLINFGEFFSILIKEFAYFEGEKFLWDP